MRKTILIFLAVIIASCFMSFNAIGEQVNEETRKHLASGVSAVEAAASPKDLLAAVEEIKMAIKISPVWPEAHLALAKVLAAINKPVGAIKELNRYLELLPDAPDRGNVRSDIKRLEETRAIAKKIGMSGLAFASLSDGIYVMHVMPGSKIEKAGFKRGDKIIRINEREVSGISIYDFLKIIEEGIETKIPSIGRNIARMQGVVRDGGKPFLVTIVRGGENFGFVCQQDIFKVTSYEIEDAEFEEEVLRSKIPVVAVFWANWCPPCRNFIPVVEDTAGAYSGKVKFVHINIEENRENAEKFKIQAIPTTIFFKDGNAVDSFKGSNSEELKKKISDIENLKASPVPLQEGKKIEYGEQKPGSTFSPAVKRQTGPIGMAVKAVADGFLVMAIKPGFPAEKAEIKIGDLIVWIDGQDVKGASMQKFLGALDGTPGTEINIDIMRKGEKYRFILERSAP